MNENSNQINWSDRCWKEMLIYQRRREILPDTLDKLACWIDLKPGLTVVDIGCGLGFLGYTFWPYFGQGGSYLGIDLSRELLCETARSAKKWAVGGHADFQAGDAYQLPLADSCADVVICQTLMMHLEHPQQALAEMIRVSRSGGLVVCLEPDNVATLMTLAYPSVPRFDIEARLLFAKVALVCNKGRINRGQGDNSIGANIPSMMKQLGLSDIGVRINDRVYYTEPPYEGDLQQFHLEWDRKKWLDDELCRVRIDRDEQDFAAGGGDPGEFERYRKLYDSIRATIQQQLNDGTFFQCGSGDFYICKGRKLDQNDQRQTQSVDQV
ncbi:MAG: methyltransferase domain-containing protein [bacterium]